MTAFALKVSGALFVAAAVMLWPGLAVLTIGSLVGGLGAAFYYHMGGRFIAGLEVLTHYATSLVRFGRVFFGFGQLVLAAGLLHAGIPPERYRPIFHLNAAWMLVVGQVMLRVAIGASG